MYWVCEKDLAMSGVNFTVYSLHCNNSEVYEINEKKKKNSVSEKNA